MHTTDIWLKNLGIDHLSPMQMQMHAAVAEGKDVLLLSPTGSGKTLAYLLPLCERIDANNPALQTIVVVPTRELAQQSEAVLRDMKTPLRSASLHGGRSAMSEHQGLKASPPHLIFATPGRLLDHIGKENINIHTVRTLVIDEFDKCMEMGFDAEMKALLKLMPAVRQLLLTSATYHEEAQQFLHEQLRATKRVIHTLDFSTHDAPLERRQNFVVHSPEKDKLATLQKLLTHLQGAPTIVFVAHRESAERVEHHLDKSGFDSELYHGGMLQEHREKALYKFRNASKNILVSTDLAARGLDFPQVAAIIHYHLPIDEYNCTHRSGRTARWMAAGEVYFIIGPEEELPAYVQEPQPLRVDHIHPQATRSEWTTLYIGKGKKDKLSKTDIVGHFCKCGGLESADIGRIDVSQHFAFAAVKRNKLKQLLQLIAGKKIKGLKTIIEEVRN